MNKTAHFYLINITVGICCAWNFTNVDTKMYVLDEIIFIYILRNGDQGYFWPMYYAQKKI